MPRLTIPKREAFAQHYALHGNASAAYRHAYETKGQSANSIGVKAHQLLDDPKVALRIQELREIAAKKADEKFSVDAEYLLKRFYDVVEMDVADIMDDQGGVLPIKQWPKIWRQSIQGLDVIEMVNKGDLVGVVKKLKLPDRGKYLEMLGRHIDVQAFKDKVEHEAGGTLQEMLEKARQERAVE